MFFRRLHSLFILALWGVVSLFFTILCLPFTFLPASIRYDNKFYFRLSSLWNALCLRLAGISTPVTDAQLLPSYPDQPSIIIANHASALDILVLDALMGNTPRIWISKASYLKIPLFGTLLRRMHTTVDTSSPRAAARSLSKIRNFARNKKGHVILFPEGGRFTDGQIHAFFGGFGVLARVLKRPVVPIYLRNSHHIFPPHSIRIDARLPLCVEVGPAFYRQEDESDDAFVQRVREWFCQKVAKPV